MIKLVVGLGNPGQKYAKTRHNAGFLLLDELICTGDAVFSPQSRFFGELAEMKVGERKLYLLKPTTFMNRSGRSVSAVMKYYKIQMEEVLVVHDELDFELGVLKLKLGGGHGGHNGLRDIIAATGSKGFLRLRVGIGRPQGSRAIADYVLSDFSRLDFELLVSKFASFLVLMPLLLAGNVESAMHELHSQ
ncbi:aminoacyl-tRNA hydrolase [methanotrophic endosymbiont of Bathymodiolus puteoserpentis (Logatchev)]|uniref:aminoacyl-tRNA hydrolase n=1 Tax=methanotrophic endosymbiont of Bathymodiolus puteoserpentis (Logatchev) TaxID=343235 RepID=UPI0013CD1C04|nr:aminoacyl-tRNA hydrolase [methanotrophic endosymbiont of Bathymodiolus puteoserpentis (Logatchev)]SHE21224.1 Peptidyl-tRNA hydrolase [methanotrophic endosymbiont of Bathymodiolus puteoserpentis (Logatchev)]